MRMYCSNCDLHTKTKVIHGLSAWVKGKFSIHCCPYCGNERLLKLVDVKMNFPLDRIPCSMDAQLREHEQSVKNLTE